jgi:beta-lactam-binding protein with PASTA domain
MKGFIRFIFSRLFIVNLLVYIVLIAGIFYMLNSYLVTFTDHGKSISVPDFRGFHISELNDFVSGKEVEYIIIDSVYDMKQPKGVVIEQAPLPDALVKKGRKVYLTVNATQRPKVSVPNLLDITLRQAQAILQSIGLNVGEIKYMPETCVNCVVGMEYNELPIDEGFMITKGSKIDLILGAGLSGDLVRVPILINKNFNQVDSTLKNNQLTIGAIVYEDCKNAEDSAAAKVFKQVPNYGKDRFINKGNYISVFLTSNESKIPEIIAIAVEQEIQTISNDDEESNDDSDEK